MPSNALLRWQNDRLPRLNALDAQVAATLAVVPPPTLAEENLRALVALLCARFQGFCRDLYSEATDIVAGKVPAHFSVVVQRQFVAQIQLGTGNPTLQTLTRDFDRFAIDLKALLDVNPANVLRLNHLALLNKWRNFVVHHGVIAPPGPSLDIAMVRTWQTSCGELAVELDQI
ncbi:MAG: hypothetical protein L0241_19765, partial [Planctomycetia bacterium]|nr:hypothetical protein [Planctomycetia bacterium]